jgi:uncharacterized protein (DUF2062 family)
MNKYYLPDELKTLDRTRYWNNFLDGAIAAAVFCALLIGAITLLYACAPEAAAAKDREAKVLKPNVSLVERFEF